MTETKIKIGLIGLGQIGWLYDNKHPQHTNTHFQAIRKNKKAELIWAIDSNKKLGAKFTKTTGVLHHTSLDTSLESPDIIVIATPEPTHTDLVLKSMHLNPKMILLEKPVCKSWSQTNKIFSLCKRKKIKLLINYSPFFHKKTTEALKAAKALGNCLGGQFTFSGGIAENASYFLYLLSHFFESKLLLHSKGPGQSFSIKKGKSKVDFLDIPRDNYFQVEGRIFFQKGCLNIKNTFSEWSVQKTTKHKIYSDYAILDPSEKRFKLDPFHSQKPVLEKALYLLKRNVPFIPQEANLKFLHQTLDQILVPKGVTT